MQNQANFPQGDVHVNQASTVFEIPNAFPFRGSTFIDASWAEPKARDPESIKIKTTPDVSFRTALQDWARAKGREPVDTLELLNYLPASVLLAMATTSSDEQELCLLAHISCDFDQLPSQGQQGELRYIQDGQEKIVPAIHDRDLFEAVANNPWLPDEYKEAMLLRPGVQGPSEVVGDYADKAGQTHVFEYLRRNSYIPWGHYAANMAHDTVKYRIRDLSWKDMRGVRHLYYQRVFVRLAAEAGLQVPRTQMSDTELECLRCNILHELSSGQTEPDFDCALWGWNFGFDFAPSRYRLHGSHQQVHQQFALIPAWVNTAAGGQTAGEQLKSFACGDMVTEVAQDYHAQTGQDFFEDLLGCIRNNQRTDGAAGPDSLIVYEDELVLLFVPKAQVSQWELQLMPKDPVGNILEADISGREALDKAMLLALQVLEGLGAKMVTSIEFSKRFVEQSSQQRLLYSFLPKLPWSPGSFSEAQHRFICGHFPEDFAEACRRKLSVEAPGQE